MKTFLRNLTTLFNADLAELKMRTHSRITGLDTRISALTAEKHLLTGRLTALSSKVDLLEYKLDSFIDIVPGKLHK
jgi:hypothetical protein